MARIDLDDLPPWLAWPLLIFIIGILIYAYGEISKTLEEHTDSPEVKKVINDSKEALENLKEGVNDANELRQDLSDLPELPKK